MATRDQVEAVKAAARLRGCNCNPDVRVVAVAAHGGVESVEVAHDDWCKHRRDDPKAIEAMHHAVRALGAKQ